jgi:hypothetical protein
MNKDKSLYVNKNKSLYEDKNKSLYEDKHPNSSLKGTGYKDKAKALATLNLIKDRDLTYQKL